MAAEYADQGVKLVFVYTREAHPGERYPHLESFEQKLRHARDMVQRDGLLRPMLVDDLEGTVHRAYGALPNMAVIVGGGGRVLYRAAWTDADNLRLVLDKIVDWRASRHDGPPLRPYYVEWEASVRLDRQRFVEVLWETAGPRAVAEYIDAVAHSVGERAAAPLRSWHAEAAAAG